MNHHIIVDCVNAEEITVTLVKETQSVVLQLSKTMFMSQYFSHYVHNLTQKHSDTKQRKHECK